jgi:hypothetical protein
MRDHDERIIGRAKSPSSYIGLEIRHDGTCTERRVVDGKVVAQRELDQVPDPWPEVPWARP